MADQFRIREEPIRIPPPVDIRVAALSSEFASSKSIAISYGGVSGRRTTKVHILYGMGGQYPSDVMEGLKSEELKALNAQASEQPSETSGPLAVWLIPMGNRAYHLPRAAVHVLADGVEISALAPAAGWVEVPTQFSTDEMVGTTSIIPPDKPFFAYETYRAIFRQAKLNLLIADRYGRAASVLPLLTANPVANVRLLIDKEDLDLITRCRLFAEQYEIAIELRYVSPYPFHDRFLVLDNRSVWHLGGSLNTLNRATVVKLLEAEAASEALAMIEGVWAEATPVERIPRPQAKR